MVLKQYLLVKIIILSDSSPLDEVNQIGIRRKKKKSLAQTLQTLPHYRGMASIRWDDAALLL